jgi:uncharacterized membrane protein
MPETEYYPAKIKHSSLTASARQSLSGNWGIGVLGTFVYLIVAGASSMVPVAGSIILSGPLAIGFATFAMKLSREGDTDIEHIFSGFKQFGQSVVAYLLYIIAVLAGCILLIIPGIIIGLGLSQTFFIMADKPGISGVDALRESWDIMDGRKGEYFVFSLRFIGWSILCVFTLLIGFLWLIPYMQVSFAKFYDMAKTGRHPDDHDDDLSKHLLEEDLI